MWLVLVGFKISLLRISVNHCMLVLFWNKFLLLTFVGSYGTRHVLVLADFPPSTTTADLEKLLERFKDHGVVIRWVNDTVALAVFRSPSIGKYSTFAVPNYV